MDYTLEDKVISKNNAHESLERLKQKEREITFHKKRINKNTIVMCKNEDRLKIYEEQYKKQKPVVLCK